MIEEKLGIRTKGRAVKKRNGGGYQLREPIPGYSVNDNTLYFQEPDVKQNRHLWNLLPDAIEHQDEMGASR